MTKYIFQTHKRFHACDDITRPLLILVFFTPARDLKMYVLQHAAGVSNNTTKTLDEGLKIKQSWNGLRLCIKTHMQLATPISGSSDLTRAPETFPAPSGRSKLESAHKQRAKLYLISRRKTRDNITKRANKLQQLYTTHSVGQRDRQ